MINILPFITIITALTVQPTIYPAPSSILTTLSPTRFPIPLKQPIDTFPQPEPLSTFTNFGKYRVAGARSWGLGRNNVLMEQFKVELGQVRQYEIEGIVPATTMSTNVIPVVVTKASTEDNYLIPMPRSALSVDVDGDGDLDLAVVLSTSEGTTIIVAFSPFTVQPTIVSQTAFFTNIVGLGRTMATSLDPAPRTSSPVVAGGSNAALYLPGQTRIALPGKLIAFELVGSAKDAYGWSAAICKAFDGPEALLVTEPGPVNATTGKSGAVHKSNEPSLGMPTPLSAEVLAPPAEYVRFGESFACAPGGDFLVVAARRAADAGQPNAHSLRSLLVYATPLQVHNPAVAPLFVLHPEDVPLPGGVAHWMGITMLVDDVTGDGIADLVTSAHILSEEGLSETSYLVVVPDPANAATAFVIAPTRADGTPVSLVWSRLVIVRSDDGPALLVFSASASSAQDYEWNSVEYLALTLPFSPTSPGNGSSTTTTMPVSPAGTTTGATSEQTTGNGGGDVPTTAAPASSTTTTTPLASSGAGGDAPASAMRGSAPSSTSPVVAVVAGAAAFLVVTVLAVLFFCFVVRRRRNEPRPATSVELPVVAGGGRSSVTRSRSRSAVRRPSTSSLSAATRPYDHVPAAKATPSFPVPSRPPPRDKQYARGDLGTNVAAQGPGRYVQGDLARYY